LVLPLASPYRPKWQGGDIVDWWIWLIIAWFALNILIALGYMGVYYFVLSKV
jgi:hypothetical protein